MSAYKSEYPIIFSGADVRAIIAGRKTQTRRLVKRPRSMFMGDLSRAVPDLLWGLTPGLHVPCADGTTQRLRNPWGWPAPDAIDLWVRESWRMETRLHDDVAPSDLKADETIVHYDADVDWSDNKTIGRTRSPLHMPRWASRLTLRIVKVRVEKLGCITEDDAKAEGIEARDFTKRAEFAVLWDEIYPDSGCWTSDPWVWVVEFRRVET